MLFSDGVEIVAKKTVQVEIEEGVYDRFNIAKEPGRAAALGWYPVELTGSGSLPDVSTLVFDVDKYTGAYVVVPDDRVLSFRSLYTKMTMAGIDMSEVYTAAHSDVAVEQLLDLARTARHGATIDLDDSMFVSGMNDLVGHVAVPSCTQARMDAVLA